MQLRRCEVVYRDRDDMVVTTHVYGPTPGEFAEVHPPGSIVEGRGVVMEVRRVQEKWREDCDRPRRTYWEREARTNHFFTKDLKREGVVGGAGPDRVPSYQSGAGESCREESEAAGRRFGDHDGEEA